MMHKGIKALLVFCLLLCGCKSQNIEKTKPKKATKELSAEQKLDQKVNQWIDSHGLEEQVLQMFMITPEALTGSESVSVADDSFKASLEQYPVGGLIFFCTESRESRSDKKFTFNDSIRLFSDGIVCTIFQCR